MPIESHYCYRKKAKDLLFFPLIILHFVFLPTQTANDLDNRQRKKWESKKTESEDLEGFPPVIFIELL